MRAGDGCPVIARTASGEPPSSPTADAAKTPTSSPRCGRWIGAASAENEPGWPNSTQGGSGGLARSAGPLFVS